MLNKIIAPGGTTVIHSHPVNENNEPVAPPSDVTWAENGGIGSLQLPGGLNTDVLYTAGPTPGVSTVTMACQSKSAQVLVTVEAPIVLPFDHFNPSFD